MHRGRKSGFSLVELMIVVGILSILGAIAAPAYRLFNARAKQTEAKINIQSIVTLQEVYNQNEEVYFPLVSTDPSGTVKTFSTSADTFATSSTSCHIPNALGFVLSSCLNVRYGYLIVGLKYAFGVAAKEISTVAGERRVFPSCVPSPPWSFTYSILGTRSQYFLVYGSRISKEFGFLELYLCARCLYG